MPNPKSTDEDVDERLEEIREQKAEYVNEEPRAAGRRRLRGGLARKPVGRGRKSLSRTN